MLKRIITVSREFGSGGRSIGKKVAKQLGWDYYDSEFVKAVAEKTGFDPKYIEEAGELSPGKSKLSYAFSSVGAPEMMNGMSSSDYLWSVQCKTILEIADKSPCVIVGRCADYILAERSDVINVYIHADTDYRCDRIVRLYGEQSQMPKKRLADKDIRRRNNYRHYTGREWGVSQNYDISLNSGTIGEDKCVSIITSLIDDIK